MICINFVYLSFMHDGYDFVVKARFEQAVPVWEIKIIRVLMPYLHSLGRTNSSSADAQFLDIMNELRNITRKENAMIGLYCWMISRNSNKMYIIKFWNNLNAYKIFMKLINLGELCTILIN